MTPALLHALDPHVAVYWSVVLIITAAFVHSATTQKGSAMPARGRSWLFVVLILATFLAWRWPFLLDPNELNTDESQFIAGALTLRHDPVFWRSVDGMTVGPLVYFAPLLFSFLGAPLDFFGARLLGIVLVWIALTCTYRLLRIHSSDQAARLILVPAVLYFAAASDPDLTHYSSELVPVCLIALALRFVAMAAPPETPRRLDLLLGGFFAGLLPWAKLQAMPIGFVVVAIGLTLLMIDARSGLRQRGIHVAWLLGGAVLPQIAMAIFLTATGTWADFYRSYIVQNFFYVDPEFHGRSIGGRFVNWDQAIVLGLVLVGAVFAIALAGLALNVVRKQRPHWLVVAGGFLVAMAAGAVLFPGRDFLHYTLLLLVPLVAWGGACLGDLLRVSPVWRQAPALFVLATGAALVGVRLTEPTPPIVATLGSEHGHRYTELGELTRLATASEKSLAVWGWHAQAYVESGSRQAARSAYSFWSIAPNPQREYFRRRFLADFVRNRPAAFIDAVGPHDFFFKDRTTNGHETFPALAEVVRRDYCLLADVGYARMYARRDRVACSEITPAAVQSALARGSRPRNVRILGMEDLSRFELSKKVIKGAFAVMMLPPAKIDWTLTGDERELYLDYGYDPAADRQTQGNGTTFIVEIIGLDEAPNVIAHFHHDPAHIARERGQHERRIVLPPYAPGSRLQIRTEPGPGDDNAWDWAYITNVRFFRTASYTIHQFPGFNRAPDYVDAPLANFVDVGDRRILQLHAPGSISYVATGAEKHLSLSIGFRDGAYQNGGNTNGATFSVIATPPNETPEVLFRRTLRPVQNNEDRGDQRVDVELPALAPGSELKVVIDPDGSHAWDWTYVTDLRLD